MLEFAAEHPYLVVVAVVGFFWYFRSSDYTGYCVYIMVREPDHKVKVGKAQDPEARLAAGRTWVPEGLHLWTFVAYATEQEAFSIEARVHQLLQSDSITSKGDIGGTEWFSVSRNVALAVIRQAERELDTGGNEISLRLKWNLYGFRYRVFEPIKVSIVGLVLLLIWI